MSFISEGLPLDTLAPGNSALPCVGLERKLLELQVLVEGCGKDEQAEY